MLNFRVCQLVVLWLCWNWFKTQLNFVLWIFEHWRQFLWYMMLMTLKFITHTLKAPLVFGQLLCSHVMMMNEEYIGDKQGFFSFLNIASWSIWRIIVYVAAFRISFLAKIHVEGCM